MMSNIPKQARFVMEVAPPQFISVIKRPLIKVLATINEEETIKREIRKEASRQLIPVPR